MLYELRGRTAVLVGQLDADTATIECTSAGGCMLVYQNEVTGDPWFRASRLFTQPFTFARPRAVRH